MKHGPAKLPMRDALLCSKASHLCSARQAINVRSEESSRSGEMFHLSDGPLLQFSSLSNHLVHLAINADAHLLLFVHKVKPFLQ